MFRIERKYLALFLGGRDEGGGLDGRVPAGLHVPLRPHHGPPLHLRGRGGGGRLGPELPGRGTESSICGFLDFPHIVSSKKR